MSTTKKVHKDIRRGLALVISACLLASAEAQVAPSPSNTADPQTVQTQSLAGSAEQKSVQAPSDPIPDDVDRDPASPASEGDQPKLDKNVYALVPVSDLAQLSKPAVVNDGVGWRAWLGFLSSVAWPLATLIIVWRLLKSPQIALVLTKLAQHATQINIAGLEFKLSEGAKATLEDLQKLIKQIPDTQEDWVAASHMDAQFQNVISGLRAYLCQANTQVVNTPLTDADFKGFRFTLHVPDVLLAHSMRQLVDYVGADRGGSGRLFSARRGIVGLAWRLEDSEFRHQSYSEDELVKYWGMTRAEARDTKSTDKGVLMAFLIKSSQGLPLAVLYADAKVSLLFDEARNLARAAAVTFDLLDKQIKTLCKDCGLIDSLQDLEKARVKVRQVDMYRP